MKKGLNGSFFVILLKTSRHIMAKVFKMWIYHETNKPKIIDSDNLGEHESLGWVDSPAQFLKLKDIGIDQEKTDAGDPSETAKAQQALEAVEGVRQSLNNALNIDIMNKNQLETYIKEHYAVDLDKRKTLKVLRKQAKKLAGV